MTPGASSHRFNLEDDSPLSLTPLTSTLTDLIYDFEKSEQTRDDIKIEPKPFSKPNAKRRSSTSNHTNVTKTAVGLRQLAKKIGETPMSWAKAPKGCMIVSKLNDQSLVTFTVDIASWLLRLGLTVYIQNLLLENYEKLSCVDSKEINSYRKNEDVKLYLWDVDGNFDLSNVDFIISLGGDGTVLFSAWLFQEKVPPIIPFNLGSLGFLTVFDSKRIENTIKSVLDNDEVLDFNVGHENEF
jgi:NAD+ kinase